MRSWRGDRAHPAAGDRGEPVATATNVMAVTSDRDRVSVDSGHVRGIEFALGCSAHQTKVGDLPDS